MISYTATTTIDEYLEAQDLFQRKFSPVGYYVARWLPACIILVIAGNQFFKSATELSARQSLIIGLIPIAFFFLAVLGTPAIKRRALSKRYERELPNMQNVFVEVNEFGYTARIPNASEGRIPWVAFEGYVEGKTIWILLKGYTFHPIPKHALSPSEQEEFRGLLAAYSVPYKKNKV
ncbi:YcxB family protein [Terriglobus saanensis]|uniref:YcxB-like C-terminal domain-containing protein n=1 Tax=Terriglobus saanensis (strain ATCC BAA-1853 / DSM 23119 / SP1PR4) TaxID=401053 RepID=E8V1P8_TERSS|nr:YcxB family protein [Terriglobus saanensis]ADV82329.1 hypothetical protein AciPR4_1506 [Terriglobus saanensis SP1PR4]